MMLRPAAETRLTWLLGRSVFRASDQTRVIRLLQARQTSVEHLTYIATINKVLHTVVNHLKAIPCSRAQALVDEIVRRRPQAGEIGTHRENIRARLLEILRLLTRAGMRAMAIKGCSLFWLAPEYGLRYMRDIDLLFRDAAEMAEAGRVLIGAGFVVDEREGPWLQNLSPIAGKEVLGAHYTLRLPGQPLKVEISSGAVPVAELGFLKTELWKRASLVDLGPGQVYLPSVEDAVLILLAHSASHGHFTLKDFNDGHVLVGARATGPDWDYLIRGLTANALEPFMAYFGRILKEGYDFADPTLEGLKTRCPALVRASLDRALLLNDPSIARRAFTRGLIGFTYELHSGRRLRAFLQFVASFWSFYRQHRYARWPGWVQSVVDRTERGPFLSGNLPYGTHILLAPISPQCMDSWNGRPFASRELTMRLRRAGYRARQIEPLNAVCVLTDHGELLLNPLGAFLPTRYAVFYDEDLEALTETLDGIDRTLDMPALEMQS